ncbi:MAG: OmpA family protein [Phycisphaerales bacterium]|nr:OmpA family protein [Phycisphaerales bacterium]
MRARGSMLAVLGVAGLLLGSGCTDPQALQIAALQRDKMALEKENALLKSQIDDLIIRLKRNDRDLAQLRAELENARNQLATLDKLPPGWDQSGGVAWIDVAENILFDSGKAVIKQEGLAKLSEIAGTIRNDAELSARGIYVIGHTDTDPIRITKDKWVDNLDLSINRGAAVTRELYRLGLDPKSVVAGGQGEFNPKAPNDNRANKATNRRVQIMAVVRPPTEGSARRAGTAGPDAGTTTVGDETSE